MKLMYYSNPKHFTLTLFLLFSLSFLNAQCPNLVWEDEFDGTTLDETKWSYQIGDGCDINLCGWGNNELQWYRRENVEVGDGTLKIIAKRESFSNKSYTSARIRTIDKGDWTYGRFEASIKLPKGQGMWPAFWMLPTDETYGGWPQSGEIDIVELIGSEPEVAHGTIHFGPPWPNNRSSGEDITLNEGIFNDEFHTFAIEWENGQIRWLLDDYLYATKTTGDVSPSRWPFDQRFHFILNVAVGGNWPGAPNFGTPFPQTMEVEYVRVYDGYLPYITGDRKVANQSTNVKYSLGNLDEGSTVSWSLPEGATIVNGEGTSEIIVNFGNSGGDIKATIDNGCTTKEINLNVFVEPALAPEFSFENFDDEARITFNFATGTLTEEVQNPGANEINNSALVGRYQRNSAEQFDILVYDVDNLGDVGPFLSGEKKFYLDVYTDAQEGTEILLQLERNSATTPSNFPTGRHSRFQATTTSRNAWQRLEFKLLDRPDASVPNSTVDQFIFLFASNSSNGSTYYFDNFDVYSPATATSTKEQVNYETELLPIFPNPAKDELILQNRLATRIQRLQFFDLKGNLIQQRIIDLGSNEQTRIDISALPRGVYKLLLAAESGKQYLQKVVKL